jgi:hypothetical protein
VPSERRRQIVSHLALERCPFDVEPDAWLEMSGAKSYETFFHVERAELARLSAHEVAHERELREAHRLFREIGAPIRAAEVAKELDG